jgi:hypothetical protein
VWVVVTGRGGSGLCGLFGAMVTLDKSENKQDKLKNWKIKRYDLGVGT